MKKFFESLKEMWQDPKKRGLVQISFWIIFFFVIALVYRASTTISDTNVNDSSNKNNSVKSNVVNSYEYECVLSDSTKINGTHYKNKEILYINNDKYYLINNDYYLAKTNTLVNMLYPLKEWEYNSIKNIMNKFKYTSKLEYTNNIIKYEYTINSNSYNSIYLTDYKDDINISLNIDKNNIINSVHISYVNYSVDIIYKNINEINNLEISE